jgi:UDP:flavonoid glycosyltransferase YjiC (YdhE family)
MRITILALGSRGDVQPLVALGVGLQRTSRHEVSFVTTDDSEELVRNRGLDFFPLGVNVRELLGTRAAWDVLESAPHDWLFPRVAAVVHRGGAGTTGAGLRSGVPSVLVPHFGDQAFWGRRIMELGVGPKPIPRKRLTAERLGAAIATAVTDENIRARAADLGERIRTEGGIGRAIEVVERGLSLNRRASG